MSKYNSKKVVKDDITFDSKIELEYYDYLCLLRKEGSVTNFKCHPVYELQPSFGEKGNIIHAIKYEADFEVWYADGITYVIDIKGMPTADAKIKRKLFLYKFPDMKLHRITKFHGEWVDFFKNEDRKRTNKKEKLAKGCEINTNTSS